MNIRNRQTFTTLVFGSLFALHAGADDKLNKDWCNLNILMEKLEDVAKGRSDEMTLNLVRSLESQLPVKVQINPVPVKDGEKQRSEIWISVLHPETAEYRAPIEIS